MKLTGEGQGYFDNMYREQPMSRENAELNEKRNAALNQVVPDQNSIASNDKGIEKIEHIEESDELKLPPIDKQGPS